MLEAMSILNKDKMKVWISHGRNIDNIPVINIVVHSLPTYAYLGYKNNFLLKFFGGKNNVSKSNYREVTCFTFIWNGKSVI